MPKYLLYADETNDQPSNEAKFFIYGGLIVPTERLATLNMKLEAIRQIHGYKTGDVFKFNSRSRPVYVTKSSHASAKNSVLETCNELGCKFIATLTHHSIAQQEKRLEWGANTVLLRFDAFLNWHDERGMCFLDGFANPAKMKAYMTEKFTIGLRFPDGTTKRLKRVEQYAATWQQLSHACSASDIVLGALRYSVNASAGDKTAGLLFRRVARLLAWGKQNKRIADLLQFQPSIDKIRVQRYRDDYNALIAKLSEFSNAGITRNKSSSSGFTPDWQQNQYQHNAKEAERDVSSVGTADECPYFWEPDTAHN